MEALAKQREEWQNQIELLDDQNETDDLEAKTEERKAQADHEKKMRKAAEELADLERRFESEYPKMKAYLTPFTSEGYTQPTGRTYERRTTKGPVSYKSLLGAGVLGEDKDSVGRFYYSTVAGNNDRELGAFPPHSFSSGHFERHYETILKVQAFLREFGPVMAQEERGILAP